MLRFKSSSCNILSIVVMMFIFSKTSGRPKRSQSPWDLQFENMKGIANFGDFECPDAGLFPKTDECSEYYKCLFPDMNPFGTFGCPNGELFDPIYRRCDIAKIVDCEGCAENGMKIYDKSSSGSYIVCSNGYGIKRNCERDHIFSKTKSQCIPGKRQTQEIQNDNKIKKGTKSMVVARNNKGIHSASDSLNEGSISHVSAEGDIWSQTMALLDDDGTSAFGFVEGAQAASAASAAGTNATSASDGTSGSQVLAKSSNSETQSRTQSSKSGSISLATSKSRKNRKEKEGASTGEASAKNNGTTKSSSVSSNVDGFLSGSMAEGEGLSQSQSNHNRSFTRSKSGTTAGVASSSASSSESQAKSEWVRAHEFGKAQAMSSNRETNVQSKSSSKQSGSGGKSNSKTQSQNSKSDSSSVEAAQNEETSTAENEEERSINPEIESSTRSEDWDSTHHSSSEDELNKGESEKEKRVNKSKLDSESESETGENEFPSTTETESESHSYSQSNYDSSEASNKNFQTSNKNLNNKKKISQNGKGNEDETMSDEQRNTGYETHQSNNNKVSRYGDVESGSTEEVITDSREYKIKKDKDNRINSMNHEKQTQGSNSGEEDFSTTEESKKESISSKKKVKSIEPKPEDKKTSSGAKISYGRSVVTIEDTKNEEDAGTRSTNKSTNSTRKINGPEIKLGESPEDQMNKNKVKNFHNVSEIGSEKNKISSTNNTGTDIIVETDTKVENDDDGSPNDTENKTKPVVKTESAAENKRNATVTENGENTSENSQAANTEDEESGDIIFTKSVITKVESSYSFNSHKMEEEKDGEKQIFESNSTQLRDSTGEENASLNLKSKNSGGNTTEASQNQSSTSNQRQTDIGNMKQTRVNKEGKVKSGETYIEKQVVESSSDDADASTGHTNNTTGITENSNSPLLQPKDKNNSIITAATGITKENKEKGSDGFTVTKTERHDAKSEIEKKLIQKTIKGEGEGEPDSKVDRKSSRAKAEAMSVVTKEKDEEADEAEKNKTSENSGQ